MRLIAGSPAQPAGASSVETVPAPAIAPQEIRSTASISWRAVARALGIVTLAVTVAILAGLDYPSLLGRWEGFGSFPLMPGPPPPLTFKITPGGFVYNMSLTRYALVDLGYYTAEWLGWSLTAFRLPVLVAGAASIAAFFAIARRQEGFWPAVIASLTLALNPMILVFWHQLIVPMFSVMFLLLLIERYQYLEQASHQHQFSHDRRALLWGIPTLALVFAMLLLHYGPGRAYGGIVMVWWAAVIAWRAMQAHRWGRPVNRRMLLAVPACALIVVVVLILLDPGNAHYIVAPLDLVMDPQSEYVKSSGELKWVIENVPIVLTSIVPPLALVPGRFADFSTDLLADYRYYLLPTVMVPIVLIGFAVTIGRVRHSAQTGLTLLLLAVTLAAPMFSSGASISAYRMVFALIPLSLCAAAGIGWLLGRQSTALRAGAAGLLVVVLAIQVGQVSAEVSRHRAFVASFAQRWTPGADRRQFAGSVDRGVNPDDERLSNGSYRYYVEEGGLAALAAAYRLRARVPESQQPNEAVLVQLDGSVQRDDPSSVAKLVFFLRELGVPATLYDPAAQRLRGASFGQSTTYVVAANSVAAAGARRQLEAAGLTVRLHEHKP